MSDAAAPTSRLLWCSNSRATPGPRKAAPRKTALPHSSPACALFQTHGSFNARAGERGGVCAHENQNGFLPGRQGGDAKWLDEAAVFRARSFCWRIAKSRWQMLLLPAKGPNCVPTSPSSITRPRSRPSTPPAASQVPFTSGHHTYRRPVQLFAVPSPTTGRPNHAAAPGNSKSCVTTPTPWLNTGVGLPRAPPRDLLPPGPPDANRPDLTARRSSTAPAGPSIPDCICAALSHEGAIFPRRQHLRARRHKTRLQLRLHPARRAQHHFRGRHHRPAPLIRLWPASCPPMRFSSERQKPGISSDPMAGTIRAARLRDEPIRSRGEKVVLSAGVWIPRMRQQGCGHAGCRARRQLATRTDDLRRGTFPDRRSAGKRRSFSRPGRCRRGWPVPRRAGRRGDRPPGVVRAEARFPRRS